MKLFSINAIVLFLIVSMAYSQNQVIHIWEPGSMEENDRQHSEQLVGKNITEVHQPTLRIFLPVKRDLHCPAVVVFPGGGYRQIVIDKEGYKIARWLNANGIAAFVLAYRLNIDSALLDAQRALSIVRSRAGEFHVDPERIGVMGFSAGAHLSANLAVHGNQSIQNDFIDSVSCKPNFMVLVYGSFNGLSKSVDKQTPPAFLVHASNDERVLVSQSIGLFSALRGAGIPVEMHIYETGGHGFALQEDRGPVISWAQRCIDWMKIRGILAGQ